MKPTLAGTSFTASAVHTLIEIGQNGVLTAAQLCEALNLEKSSISRMVRKLVNNGEIQESPSERDGREKQLTLTSKGWQSLAEINLFAQMQVSSALENIAGSQRHKVLDGLAIYADALAASRRGDFKVANTDMTIEAGYRAGIIGRAVEMHARYYARTVGFGRFFENKLASGLSEFVGRLDTPANQLWAAMSAGHIVGTIAIDGEDLGTHIAHLRWFIVDDAQRGSGVGRRLLTAAISFCEQQHFKEIQLWTFKGLDAARRLYEEAGFTLAEERPGRQWGEEVIEQRFQRKRTTIDVHF
ncbi:bifunctional helix-turn-helix transcriptional regulator/GNAT family N-acetyltransferase [Undibacterium sp. TJN19]|uniref:bifunctional helix-turn-helix transcriptional regulator/GNAT family N-acetyltransferase n=1 Tax=Undibacterium sp. TJN19 TaxID=3413055 RepID=UPI003BF0365D